MLRSEYQHRSAVPKLRDTGIEDPVDRIQAIEALIEQGPGAAPELIELLSSVDPNDRRLALYGLGRLKRRESLPDIKMLLADGDPEVRRAALAAFGWICDDQAKLIAVAGEMARDPSDLPRHLALQMLDSYGTDSIPAVIALTRSSNPTVRIAG